MTTQRLLIVGVDGSAGGRHTLDWALRHAADTGASVEVVSAWSWGAAPWKLNLDDAPDVDQRYTSELQAREIAAVLEHVAGPAPTIARRVVEGEPVEVLTDAARHADLLVLGSHGQGRVATALLGSVSAGCVHRGSTPVVVVPTGTAEPECEELVPASLSTSN